MAKGRISTTASDKTDMFLLVMKKMFPDVEVVKEHKFHDARKWRFDYAFPDLKVAIEIDGAVWAGGRHVNPAGYVKDMEKLNTAASMGWLVLRFTTDDRFYLTTRKLIADTIALRKAQHIHSDEQH